MRVPLTVLLLAAFIAPLFGQDAKKITAENVSSFDRIVKGAPFSADAISESVQTLTDGNRITRRTVSHLYRDSEGRFRREDMPKELGVAGSVVDVPASIVISDPVAGLKYTLNVKNQTYRQSNSRRSFDFKLKNEEFKSKTQEFRLKSEELKLEVEKEVEKEVADSDRKAREVARVKREEQRAARDAQTATRKKMIAERDAQLEQILKGRPDAEGAIKPSSDPNAKTESLGTQTIEGIQAEGTLTTTIIPAGFIGNDLPIEVVYERWYSPELQLIILSKHSDPRFGVQNYRLTNVRRDEPPISLFSPPADYKPANQKFINPGAPPPKPPAFDKKPIPSKPVTPPPPKTISRGRSDCTSPQQTLVQYV